MANSSRGRENPTQDGVTIDLPAPALVGVIHLQPLPGAPRHTMSMTEIVGRACRDARTLRDAGFDAVIVENFGDTPFPREVLEPASVAAMAVVAEQVRRAVALPLGINALRCDGCAALGIAAAVEASFIRVNIHTGVYATDQGMISGRADETLRYRRRLGRRIAILADVHVKHATPISQPDIGTAAGEAVSRGLADGLIVTGPATGEAVDREDLRRVYESVPDCRVFVGSGARAETIAGLLTLADGVLVGTGIKPGGDPSAPIDAALARAFVQAAGRT